MGKKDSSDDVCRGDPLIDWLISFKQTENVTSGQREHQPLREVSQVNNPHNDFRFSSEININLNNRSPNAENECAPSTRLPRGQNMDISQSHVENPQSETKFIRQSRSKPSITRALMEVPPTRSQQEAEAQTIVEPQQGLKVSHLYIH